MSKIEMQLAIHRTDQSKFFPVSVLLQYARVSYCLALRDFGMLCPDSDSLHRASSRACAPKIQAFARQSASWSSVRVKPCGMALNPALESLALRLGRIDWKPARCELRAALVLGESADTGRVVAAIAGFEGEYFHAVAWCVEPLFNESQRTLENVLLSYRRFSNNSTAASPTATPQPKTTPTSNRLAIDSNVQVTKIIERVEPVYPPLARQTRVQGTVRLHAIISMTAA